MELCEGMPQQAGVSARQVERIRERARDWVAQGIHQALVVLAARRGVIFLHEAYGRLTPEPDSPPVARDAVFPIMSVTKPVTATAVLQLVEAGLVGLNRPVQDYVPEFAGKGKDDILVHHLLTHTSGLRQADVVAFVAAQRGVAVPPAEPTEHPPAHDYLHRAYGVPLWKAPGAEMAYSCLNYLLLAEIVRRVSGQSMESYLHERIFARLGMRDTYPRRPEKLTQRLVCRSPSAPLAAFIASFTSAGWGDVGVFSTALDMAVFGQAFLNQGSYGGTRMLSPATVREMTRNQIPGIGAAFRGEFHAEASWGYGWGIKGYEKWRNMAALASSQVFWHSGASGACLWIDPVSEVVAAYFSVPLLPTADGGYDWRGDAFMDMVTAAVD
jgi:CubicO group peptidase (beta-lactamase class C family)